MEWEECSDEEMEAVSKAEERQTNHKCCSGQKVSTALVKVDMKIIIGSRMDRLRASSGQITTALAFFSLPVDAGRQFWARASLVTLFSLLSDNRDGKVTFHVQKVWSPTESSCIRRATCTL